MAERRKKSTKKTAVKKRRAEMGLQHASVIRKFKEGASVTMRHRAETNLGARGAAKSKGETVRVTKQAKSAVVDEVEEYLQGLGESAKDLLSLSKKKTITKEVLRSCIKQDCHFQKEGLAAVKRASARDKKVVREGLRAHPERRDIAEASAVRVFGRGIALGRKGYNLSPDARAALSELAESYTAALGEAAGRYANAGGRPTIKSSDVGSAAGCL